MATKPETWHTRIGGNRTLVLGVVIFMLVIFSVDIYIGQIFGGTRGAEYVQFQVGGRRITLDYGAYQNDFGDWQQFQSGFGFPRAGMDSYLEDVMVAALARDAGLAIPDGTLREFIASLPVFTDSQGDFDPKRFQEMLSQHFRGLKARAFEEQARRFLLVSSYRSLYDLAYRPVTDEEAFRRWKTDNPKISVAYTWSPVAPVREALKVSDLAPAEIEEYWKGPSVQDRHRIPPRYAFEAVLIRVNDADDQAVLDYMASVKDDPELEMASKEAREKAYDEWFGQKRWNFDIGKLSPEQVDALRKENAEEFGKEEAEKVKTSAPLDPNASGTPPDLTKMDPLKLTPRDQYRIYWRRYAEKEHFLRKVMERIRAESAKAKKPLAEAAEKWSRPGVRFKVHLQEEPVDQYGPEKIDDLGGPNCPLRYALNDYATKKPEDLGEPHEEVLQRTASTEWAAGQRGWCAFRVLRVLPTEIPPLDAVREAVARDLLDERARDRVRGSLEELRREVENARRPLEEVAKEKGREVSVVPPFNVYSWRPPLPLPGKGGDETPAAERWKDPVRRTNAVMSRYSALKAVPPGALGPVLDDVAGTGAFYLAQTKSKDEPKFEEMTQAQVSMGKKAVLSERQKVLQSSTSYAVLKGRLGLMIEGKPAPDPEEQRRR